MRRDDTSTGDVQFHLDTDFPNDDLRRVRILASLDDGREYTATVLAGDNTQKTTICHGGDCESGDYSGTLAIFDGNLEAGGFITPFLPNSGQSWFDYLYSDRMAELMQLAAQHNQ